MHHCLPNQSNCWHIAPQSKNKVILANPFLHDRQFQSLCKQQQRNPEENGLRPTALIPGSCTKTKNFLARSERYISCVMHTQYRKNIQQRDTTFSFHSPTFAPWQHFPTTCLAIWKPLHDTLFTSERDGTTKHQWSMHALITFQLMCFQRSGLGTVKCVFCVMTQLWNTLHGSIQYLWL